MGLSSSQGRLLMLTSRLSDIELQEVMLSQRQNQLAMQRENETKEYMNAVNNYKIQINVTDISKDSGYRVEDLNYSNMSQMGYLVTNVNSQLYLEKDENGNWIIPNDLNGNPLCSINETTGKAIVKNKEFEIVDGSSFLKNKSALQNSIINGTVFVLNLNQENPEVTSDVLESDTKLSYVLDTSDDAEAESKHEYETAKLERLESQIEMDIKQLDTQHQAIAKEYDSVKEIINSNVDRTFKIFSSNG